MSAIDKLFVKKSFNRHAATYDAHAALQGELGERLLALVNGSLPAAPRILDIGMGTGGTTLSLGEKFPGACIHGCDLARFMVARARAKEALQTRKQLFITADAEFLPYRSACFDLVVSNFTLQWLEQWDRAVHEIFRVLKPGGTFLCSAFGEQTFAELKACFARACSEAGYMHGAALQVHGSGVRCSAALHAAGFIHSFTGISRITQHYETVAHLIRAIKGMGAQNASRKRNRALGVRRIWSRMVELYEAGFRQQEGLAATYQVIMAGGKKPAAQERAAPQQRQIK